MNLQESLLENIYTRIGNDNMEGLNRYRTYVHISLDNIEHNGQIAKCVFPEKKIMSVLKADAYGHGIEGIVPAYETFTDYYAVATVEEGLKIRKQSKKPILIFGPVPEGLMENAAKNNLTFSVGSLSYAKKLSDILGRSAGINAQCQLKIDTGLNRSGIRWRDKDNAMMQIKEIYALKNLDFTGVYTHFACGEGKEEWELAFTKMQFDRFAEACKAIEAEKLPLGIKHCTSTGGSLVHPEYQLDMVRLGMLPLGMSYSDESVSSLELRIAIKWVSFIAQIEEIYPGDAVSYGCTFYAEKPMKIAMVTCGYADGYRRAYSNKSHVLVNGKRVRVIGRVAMDYLLIDVTDVPDVIIGDEVILLGTDGVNTVSAQELSMLGDSVSGEVTCSITERVQRIYER